MGDLPKTFVNPDSRRTSSDSGSRQSSKQSNPFQIPTTASMMAYKDAMRSEDSASRSQGYTSSRSKYRHLVDVKPAAATPEQLAIAHLILSPDSSENTEGLKDFVDQKREIFLAQLAIETKREELQRLERLEREEEESLREKEAELILFRDQFRTFLEADAKATMDARVAAENKSKERIDLTMRIKATSSQNASLRNDIAHYEEKLKEYNEYKDFLNALTPDQYKREHPGEFYFKEPQQLLDMIAGLESQNLFLLRQCEDADEAVQRVRAQFNGMLEARDGELIQMVDQKDEKEAGLESTIRHNKIFGEDKEISFGNEFTEGETAQLSEEIYGYYSQLGFDSASSNDLVTMLTNIEKKMTTLIAQIEKRDSQMVRQIAAKQEKARRDQLKLRKQEEQKRLQNQKRLKALEEAKKPIFRKTGRPLVMRVQPSTGNTKQELEEIRRRQEAEQQADEELLYGELWD